MKNLLFIAALFLMSTVATDSKAPMHVDGIDIDMNGELLIATSDNPDDPMKQIRVFNMQGQQVAYRKCMLGFQCSIDLSNLPAGVYLAVASTLQLQYSENVYLE